MLTGMLYCSVMRSCGMATNPAPQAPVLGSANATCVRWLALSVFLPSQQPGKSLMRSTLLPCGQITYVLVSRFSNPLHVQDDRALAGPRLVGFASPVSSRRNLGIGTTLVVGLPRYSIFALAGRWMTPALPGSSLFGPSGAGSGAAVVALALGAAPPLLPLPPPLLALPPLLLPLPPPLALLGSLVGWLSPEWTASMLRSQAASGARLVGLVAVRPMAIAIRSMVEVRLSFSGPRIALLTKSGPPWPFELARRLLASAI